MKVIKLILIKIKKLANKIFGSQIDELYWRFRHIFDKSWAESYLSKKAINLPHRKFLIDKISDYSPFESVLEIGCASGPNLYLLAKKFPKVMFYGIDISRNAIKTGKEFFEKENINNVFLNSGEAGKLKEFRDKSIDVIFTDAVLIYKGPDKIDIAIKEMLRVARKAIILREWYSDCPGFLYRNHWMYNYKFLFAKFIPEEKITIRKLSGELLKDDWGELNYIIEVIL